MGVPAGRLATAGALALALAACNPAGDMGYVEIKTVPVAANAPAPLYLDLVKLEPPKKGVAVLQQRVGTMKLTAEGSGGQHAFLCDIVVKKNRITTVTVSVLDRPPKCQCRNGGASPSSRTCVS